MSILKAKVIGLNFYKVKNAVEEGNHVILKADVNNVHDNDAIGVYNSDNELVGYIANSDKTLSVNNRKNGNLSATELKGELDFTNKEFVAVADRVYSTCIYLKINDGSYNTLNAPDDVEVLKLEIDALKAVISDLQSQINSLRTLVTVSNEGVNSPSSDRIFYSFVGLSHFDGQDHLDGELTIKEEPIFEGAKGKAVYLKSGNHRIGVSPSIKKKQYCEDHKIPYCSNKNLKGIDFGGDIKIEELVYNEYVVVSV